MPYVFPNGFINFSKFWKDCLSTMYFPIRGRAIFHHLSKLEMDGNVLLEKHRKLKKRNKSPAACCLQNQFQHREYDNT